MRIIAATNAALSAITGMIIICRLVTGSLKILTQSGDGCQRSQSEVASKSIVASQKLGTERPINPTTCEVNSARPRRRTAAQIPNGTAINQETSNESKLNSSVIGKRCLMIASTGWLLRRERPKSPCKTAPSQRKYWRCRGASKPSIRSNVARCAAEIFSSGPTKTRTTSPGSRRINPKTKREMPNRVGISCTSRRRMYLLIG